MLGFMTFWSVCLQGTPVPATLRFPWIPDQQRGQGSLGLTSGLASTHSAATEHHSFSPAQHEFVFGLERQAGIALGSGCSEEVNTGCPVRVFALIQGELPDHKGYQGGVAEAPPLEISNTQRQTPWGWPSRDVASGSGSAGNPALSALLLGHFKVRGLRGNDTSPQSWWHLLINHV